MAVAPRRYSRQKKVIIKLRGNQRKIRQHLLWREKKVSQWPGQLAGGATILLAPYGEEAHLTSGKGAYPPFFSFNLLVKCSLFFSFTSVPPALFLSFFFFSFFVL
jgi:hypothetical protein